MRGQREAARKSNNGKLVQQLDPLVTQAEKDADRARNELRPAEDAVHDAFILAAQRIDLERLTIAGVHDITNARRGRDQIKIELPL